MASTPPDMNSFLDSAMTFIAANEAILKGSSAGAALHLALRRPGGPLAAVIGWILAVIATPTVASYLHLDTAVAAATTVVVGEQVVRRLLGVVDSWNPDGGILQKMIGPKK